MFIEAKNESAYLKAGILGFSGSGKTFTGSKIAIGLHTLIKADKPICFIDTETGSDFVLPLFDKAGKKLLVAKDRSFLKLLELCKWAETNGSIVMIDSITHFWTDLQNSFMQKKGITILLFQHWLPIKQEWRVFTDWFINSKVHILMMGRAGWEYDFEEDDEGVKELIKTGTKMKAESEMGYEPNLIIEMEHIKKEGSKIGASLLHRAWIVKDRTNQIQGKCFDNPDFNNFEPHIKTLNIGGEHLGVNAEENSTALFNNPNSGSNIYKRRQIALDNIENELVMKYPGQDRESKQIKIKILREVFNNDSWTAISEFMPEDLEIGLEKIKAYKIEAKTELKTEPEPKTEKETPKKKGK